MHIKNLVKISGLIYIEKFTSIELQPISSIELNEG